MHIVALTFGIATSLAGYFLTLYNDADIWCWIAASPKGCQETITYGKANGTCIRGNNASIYR